MKKISVCFSLMTVLLTSGCANYSARQSAVVPAQLQPSSSKALVTALHATGVQIYECRPKKDAAGQFEWAFVAPEADLFDAQGRRVGKHYAGPHWEAQDGSKVLGSLAQRADAPVPGAIPWLLLDAKSVGPQGSFSKVTDIQRINTAGGAAPASGCDASTAGKTARVDYSADYYLFAPR